MKLRVEDFSGPVPMSSSRLEEDMAKAFGGLKVIGRIARRDAKAAFRYRQEEDSREQKPRPS